MKSLNCKDHVLYLAMVTAIALSLTSIVGAVAGAVPPVRAESTVAKDSQGIERSLQEGADAWSRGDLDGFMQGYEESPLTTYVKAHDVVRGFAAIRSMYAARFGSGQRAMGHLLMSVDSLTWIDPSYAVVYGRYNLQRPTAEGGDAAGVFTLVVHNSPTGWKMISDHTS